MLLYIVRKETVVILFGCSMRWIRNVRTEQVACRIVRHDERIWKV